MRIAKVSLVLAIISSTALACGGELAPPDRSDGPGGSESSESNAPSKSNTSNEPQVGAPHPTPVQSEPSPPSDTTTPATVDPPAAQVWSIPECAEPSGPIHTYTSVADVQARTTGAWYKCTGQIGAPEDMVAIELSPSYAFFLVESEGTLVRRDSWDYQRSAAYIDTTMMNGPGYYQLNLTSGVGTQMYQSRVSEDGRFLELVQSWDAGVSRYVRATAVTP